MNDDSIVDGYVTIKGQSRKATKYAGEGGGVWFVVDPERASSAWRKAGKATESTFRPS